MIEVEYEELRHIVHLGDALKPDSVKNIRKKGQYRHADAGMKERLKKRYSRKRRYLFPGICFSYLSPRLSEPLSLPHI
jgi:CO/xanthine dehydrogenase Mo-binding subunit